MPNYLAKLTDVRAAIGPSTGQDAVLADLLGKASALAEALAGLKEGALRRTVGIVEFVTDVPTNSQFARLARRPVESISQVKQLYAPGSPADFAEASALTEYSEYVLSSQEMGRLERSYGTWYMAARCLRVTYTAGFLDPATAVSTWATATVYAAGALVSYADQVWCARAAHTSSAENLPEAESATWAKVWEVPGDLQFGVSQQTIRMWQTKDSAGVRDVINLQGGGSVNLAETKPHPALVDAARRWRSLL